MKSSILILALVLLTGCGYSSTNNELVGQVKKVVHQTPLICPNRVDADVSLGVMRNGVGSMSTQDVWLTIDDSSLIPILMKAAETGQPVKITYDEKRVTFCKNDHLVTKAELTR
jgi:hypothetical protein